MENQDSKWLTGDPVAAIRELIEQIDENPANLGNSRAMLAQLQQCMGEAALPQLQGFVGLLAKLLDIVECSLADTDLNANETLSSQSLIPFILEGLDAVDEALAQDAAGTARVNQLDQQARQQWGEIIGLLDDERGGESESLQSWNEFTSELAPSQVELDEEVAVPSAEQVSDLMLQLAEAQPAPAPEENEYFKSARPRQPLTPPGTPTAETIADIPDELVAAYLDDAGRGVAAMERAILAYEADTDNRDPLNQLRRELHTLKGASGSIGLSELASYLHQIEEMVRAGCDPNGPVPDVNPLFQVIDTVRKQITCLAECTPASSATSPSPGSEASVDGPRAAHSLSTIDEAPQHEETLRVKASQLDRLMDMLAELVMLRNRRDSGVTGLEQIHQEVIACVSRLRATCDERQLRGTESAAQFRFFTEVANDLMEISRRLRRFCEPIAEENLTVSRFIRQFRQELVELRQTPASGLFRRLRRAVRDAAHVEGKQVRMHVVGEDTGIQRSLQERLFEPLLHIVRNAVSHGIEEEAARKAAKKDFVGNVTVEVRSSTNLLVIEIRDDGKGLDYDALRRRGLEMGLLSADRVPSRQELAQLIFNSGFSTRRSVSQISGRGVGMDVVAETLKRMRSWVEVDSTPGQGTTIRLTIPLRSVIEHTMVFRSAGRLFAVPMQFVQRTGEAEAESGHAAPTLPNEFTIRFRDLFPVPLAEHPARSQKIVIRCSRSGLSRETLGAAGGSTQGVDHLTLLVDEIVGPEEVVLRPLPPLLKHHQLFTGATLSGSGDITFVFDCHRLIEMCLAHEQPDSDPQPPQTETSAATDGAEVARMLVVDDSMTARRSLVRYLSRYGFETLEAADGQEALGLLRSHTFAAVFTDLEMPKLNGFELLREIRNGERDALIPVVMVTSRTEEETKQQAEALGITAYLTKPVAEKTLAEAISNIPSTRV